MLRIKQLTRPGNSPETAPLLKPVDLEVAPGSCIVISGASGSGKSLFLRAIADLDPNEGRVSLDGTDREALSGPQWRRQVVYQPAETGWWADHTHEHFADRTVAENLSPRVGIDAEAFDWPVSRLSTGEKQRLGLIRTLALEPRVMLLDEPTSALDRNTTRLVEALLRDRMEDGAIIVLVTHDRQQADRLARRRYRMTSGELVQA